ncbi:MAG: PEP-CTERM sorting domain-containing protein [Phycisphaerae bacterium]
MKLELNRITGAVVATVVCLSCVSSANAALVVPFTEDFAASASDWRQADQVTDAIWTATGGPDGSSFVSAPFNFFGQAVGDKSILRGQDEFGSAGSSGGAFVGDWLAGGVTQFSVFVRHNGPNPLEMFTRFASPVNFPGAASVESTLIPPNTWTQLLFNIAFGDPEMTLEGPPTPDFFNTVFGDIGHVQIGVRASAQDVALDQEIMFDIDQPTITPEPGAMALMGLGLWVVARRRRRRA